MATHRKANDKRKFDRKMANTHHELILAKSDDLTAQAYAKVVANKGSQFEVMFFETGETKNANARKQKINVGDTVLICWDCTKGAKEQYYIAHKYPPFQVKELEKLGEIKVTSREEESDDEEESGFTFASASASASAGSKDEKKEDDKDTSWIDDI